jgi:tetratricopeptide (TPR) repeat protein
VSNLLIGLLGALLATNQPAAVSNLLLRKTGMVVGAVDANDPVENEYKKLLELDDASQEEVDKWIQENQAFAAQGAGISQSALNVKIEQRFEPVRKAYEDFIQRHPKHSRALLAYGSFLGDIGDEDEAREQWEKARGLDPSNPAVWNNLANYYGHRGPITNAFIYYTKAIELSPNEPVYYQNFATTVFLFRKDAREFYNIEEQQVFDRALELYRKALSLDPNNFPLATDLEQTYYGIKPPRYEEAMKAWNYALKIANDEIEREGVYVHLARNQLLSGRLDEARKNLDLVTNDQYKVLKDRLSRNLEKKSNGTNAPGGSLK